MGKNPDPGSGINIPDPQHCPYWIKLQYLILDWLIRCWPTLYRINPIPIQYQSESWNRWQAGGEGIPSIPLWTPTSQWQRSWHWKFGQKPETHLHQQFNQARGRERDKNLAGHRQSWVQGCSTILTRIESVRSRGTCPPRRGGGQVPWASGWRPGHGACTESGIYYTSGGGGWKEIPGARHSRKESLLLRWCQRPFLSTTMRNKDSEKQKLIVCVKQCTVQCTTKKTLKPSK